MFFNNCLRFFEDFGHFVMFCQNMHTAKRDIVLKSAQNPEKYFVLQNGVYTIPAQIRRNVFLYKCLYKNLYKNM